VDVEVALADPTKLASNDGSYVILKSDTDLFDELATVGAKQMDHAFQNILECVWRRNLTPVLWMPLEALPELAPHCLRDVALIPTWRELEDFEQMELPRLEAIGTEKNCLVKLTATVVIGKTKVAPI